MARRPWHRCRVLSGPWPGVFATDVDSAREYGRHWHTTFGFGVMERGAHRSMSGRGSVDAIAGDIITSNPGEIHDGRPLGVASRRWRMVYLEEAAMAAFADTPGITASLNVTQPVFRDARLLGALRRFFLRIEHWNDAPTADARCACEEVLVRACGLLIESHSTAQSPAAPPVSLRQVRDRLADDLLQTPSLSELAQMVGLSRYQLLRRFEQVYGVTPLRWQRQARAERARELIGTGRSLASAAGDSGFADQSHMTRVFAEHFGFTPGTWAQSLRTR